MKQHVLTMPQLKPRRNKYRNVKVEINGHKFDSKHEASIYAQLCCLIAAGKVHHIELQHPYSLSVNNTKIGKYIADFVVAFADGHFETWDAKGVLTPVYKLKKKLMKAIYGIDIKEV